LDSGMMIGRFACAAMRRTTSSVKAPVAVDRPMGGGVRSVDHIGEVATPNLAA
jgi:hypothetical protein